MLDMPLTEIGDIVEDQEVLEHRLALTSLARPCKQTR